MFNIALGIYIIFSILVGIGGLMFFIRSQRMVGAIVYFLGALGIFILFGIRWFDSSSSTFNKTPVQWPPVINSCPDFLTYYRRTKSNGTTSDACVDRIGVSRNGSLQVFPKNGDVNTDNDAYFFPLPSGGVSSKKDREEMCKQAIQYGLTWEGITDGQSCISSDGTTKTSSDSGSSESCPGK